MGRYRATVFYMPPSESDFVVFKACWGADNGVETAVFQTKDDAIEFAWKRWRVAPGEVLVKEKGL